MINDSKVPGVGDLAATYPIIFYPFNELNGFYFIFLKKETKLLLYICVIAGQFEINLN